MADPRSGVGSVGRQGGLRDRVIHAEASTAAITLRGATSEDREMLFQWRNDPWIVSLSTSRKTVAWDEHRQWFDGVLHNDDHLLFIVETMDGIPAGTVRLDRLDKGTARVTVYLLRPFTDHGRGVAALREACGRAFGTWPITRVVAAVRHDNRRSLSAFAKAGFRVEESDIAPPPDHRMMVLAREGEGRCP